MAKKPKRTDNRLSPPDKAAPEPEPDDTAEPPQGSLKLERDKTEAVLGGVCAGIENRTLLPAALWRILFAAGSLLFGIGLIAYIALWVTLPKASAPLAQGEEPPAPHKGLYRRVDWLSFAITTFVVMIGYWFTLATDLTLEDSGELAVGSLYAGVPHPPGYPVWTLYTWVFANFIPFSNIAWRVALSSAVAGAFSCGLIALMVSRGSSMLLEGIEIFKDIDRKVEERLCGVVGYVAGTLMAFNGFFWSQAVIVEVYTLSVLSLVGVLAFLLRWIYEPSRLRYLYWAFFWFGICFTNHQTLIVAAVGIEILIALRDRKLGRDLFLVNSLVYLFVWTVHKTVAPLQTLDNAILQKIFHFIGVGSMLSFGYLSSRTMRGQRAWIAFIRDGLFVVSAGFILLFVLLSAGLKPSAQMDSLKLGLAYMGGFLATALFVYFSLFVSAAHNKPIIDQLPRRRTDGSVAGFEIYPGLKKGNLPLLIVLLAGSALYLITLMFTAKGSGVLNSGPGIYVAHHVIGLSLVLLTFCFIWRVNRFGGHVFPVGFCGAFWALGVSFYLYMPVASMTNPPMNWGYPRTVQGFRHALTRGQYEKANPQTKIDKFVKQLARYGQGAAEEFNLVYLLLGLAPLFFIHLMRDRERSWILGLAAIYFFLAVILLIILNPQPDRQSLTLNRVFFTSSHVMISMGIGYGLALIGGLAIKHYEALRWPGFGYACFSVLASLVVLFLIDTSLVPTKQYANLFGLLLSFVMLCLFGAFPRDLPISALLGVYLMMPLHPILTHWWDNEERNHLFGYWFGHDMFTPPFEDEKGKPLYPEMARDAVLFGGTDPGRFNPTYMIFCESFIKPKNRRDPDFDRRDVYIITQNALADGTYLQYIRAHYNRSTEPDVPFFQELVRPPSERDLNVTTNLISKMVRPLDDFFMNLGYKMEDARRERGVYPPKEIYTPTYLDSQNCFNEYMLDAQRRIQLGQLRPGEVVTTNGNQLSVSGQVAVMAINALLTKIIFDNNPGHEFYIEESFPLDWMFPHLTPYGIIMKINRDPIPEMTQEIVDRDHRFWMEYSKRLTGNWIDYDTPVQDIVDFSRRVYIEGNFAGYEGDMDFVRDDNAKKAFSKLRSAQAHLYYWRINHAGAAKNLVEQARMIKEADFAFKQAVAFCPYSPEAVFKYVNLLTSLANRDPSRLDDAIGITEVCLEMDEANEAVADLLRQLTAMRAQLAGAPLPPPNAPVAVPSTAQQPAPPAAPAKPLQITPDANGNVLTPFGPIPAATLQALTATLPGLQVQYQTNSANPQIAISLATAYFQTGQTNLAVSILERLVSQPELDPAVLGALATAFQHLGRAQSLETTLARLVQVTPTSPEAHYDLAAIRAAVAGVLTANKQAAAAKQRNDLAMKSLQTAILLSDQRRATNKQARDLREQARGDNRFTALHGEKAWQDTMGAK